MRPDPTRSAENAPLPVVLELPRMQFGMLSFGMVSGLDLGRSLEPYLAGPIEERPHARRYPLQIRDGVGIAIPFTVPLFGSHELRLDDAEQRLWVGVPDLDFVSGAVYPRIAAYIQGEPRQRGRCICYPLLMKPGERFAVPIATVGEIAVEIAEQGAPRR